jgi:soluble lytic murein transglycosylase
MSRNRPRTNNLQPSSGRVIVYYLIAIAAVAALAWAVMAVYPRLLPYEKKLDRGYIEAAYSQALSAADKNPSPENMRQLVHALVLKGNIGRADLLAHTAGVDDELLKLARGFELSTLEEAKRTGAIANHFTSGELAPLRSFPVYQNLKFFTGYQLALLGDWHGAKDYFMQAWHDGVSPELKPFLQYYYGRSLILKGDKKEKARGYRLLGKLAEGRDEYGLAARVSLNQLQAAIDAGQEAFIGIYLSKISHAGKSWEYPKALADLGDYYIKRDDPVKAAGSYLRALAEYPEEPTTRSSIASGLVDALTPLSGKLLDLKGAILTQDGTNVLYVWVQALAETKAAKRAIPILSLASLDERNLELRFQAMEALSFAHYVTGNRKEMESLLLLENLTPKMPDEALQASYINYARLLRDAGETMPAIGYYKSAQKLKGPYGSEACFEEYTLMKERFGSLDIPRSIELLRRVVKEPTSKQRMQAAEELAALSVLAGQRKIANETLSEMASEAPDWEVFWRIFFARHGGDSKKAGEEIAKIKVNRFSYYELQPLQELGEDNIAATERPYYLNAESFREYLAGYFVTELAANGQETDTTANAIVLRNLELTSSERASSWAATELLEDGLKGDRALTDYVLSTAYPTPYRQIVEAVSRRYNVPAELIYAVMKKESGFDPQALSSAGASGLMQLMPATAGEYRQFLPKDLQGGSLSNPECNIHLGAAYLSSLRTEFVQDYLVFSAYNGGPGNVNRWLRLIGTSDPVLFTELIPNDENEQFVKKVLKYSLVYRFILRSR